MPARDEKVETTNSTRATKRTLNQLRIKSGKQSSLLKIWQHYVNLRLLKRLSAEVDDIHRAYHQAVVSKKLRHGP